MSEPQPSQAHDHPEPSRPAQPIVLTYFPMRELPERVRQSLLKQLASMQRDPEQKDRGSSSGLP